MDPTYRKFQNRYYQLRFQLFRMEEIDLSEVRSIIDSLLERGYYDLYGAAFNLYYNYHLNIGQFEQSEVLLEELRQASEKVGSYVRVYYHNCVALQQRYLHQNLNAMLEHCEIARKLAEEIKPTDHYARYSVYQLTGSALAGIGRYVEAYRYLIKALNSYLPRQLRFCKALTYHWLGSIEDIYSNTKQALHYGLKCVDIHKKFQANPPTYTMNLIGLTYFKMGNAEKALEVFSESLSAAEKTGQCGVASSVHIHLGLVYQQLIGDYPKALTHYQKSLEYYSNKQNTSEYAFRLQKIANTYCDMGELELAKKNYDQAIQIMAQFEKFDFTIPLYLSVARFKSHQKEYTTAIEYVQKAEALLDKVSDNTIKMNTYTVYTDIFREMGQFEKALQYCQLNLDLQKEIFDQRLRANMELLQLHNEGEEGE